MKEYIKPRFEVAQICVNERIAAGSCITQGTCYDDGAPVNCKFLTEIRDNQ
jgi:hypothetical protein